MIAVNCNSCFSNSPALTSSEKYERKRAYSNDDELTKSKKTKVTFYTREDSSTLSKYKITRLARTLQSQSSREINFNQLVNYPCSHEEVPLLIESKIDSRDFSDQEIIDIISSGNLENFRLLISHLKSLEEGFNTVIWGEHFGLTCIHWAVHFKKLNIIQFLAETLKVEIDLEDNLENQWAPAIKRALDGPITEETLQIVHCLIENHAALDELFYLEGDDRAEWKTLVAYYALNNDFERVKILVEAGANLNIPDSECKTPIQVITESLMEEGGQENEYSIHRVKIAYYLLTKGAKFKSEDARQFMIKLCQILETV